MKTIVWDVDDVLSDLMGAWFEDYAASSGADRFITYDRLTSNPPHALLGISHMEYLASLDKFRLSEMAEMMPPVAEVFEWFCRYGDSAHNVALTAAPLSASPVSAQWVMRNFGRWIRSFNVIPSSRPGIEAARYHTSKSDFLGWWGKADILVDDSEENIAGAISLGINTVVVPRPWNQSGQTMNEALEELAELVLSPIKTYLFKWSI
ncbi:MAG: hypothetical protein ABSF90_01805 [Syntrophobacteraceae bacterium]|jgi:hypothetical protein